MGIWFNLRIRRPDRSFYSKLKLVDYPGVVTVLIGNVCLLLALQWGGNEYPWNSAPVISCLVLGVAFWAAFIFVEVKIAKDPIIPVRLFFIRNSLFGNLTNFCQGWIALGFVYYTREHSPRFYSVSLLANSFLLTVDPSPAIFWQSVQGVSALTSGYRFIPSLVATVISTIVSGALTEKLGMVKPFVAAGMFGMIVGCALLGAFARPDWVGPLEGCFGLKSRSN